MIQTGGLVTDGKFGFMPGHVRDWRAVFTGESERWITTHDIQGPPALGWLFRMKLDVSVKETHTHDLEAEVGSIHDRYSTSNIFIQLHIVFAKSPLCPQQTG